MKYVQILNALVTAFGAAMGTIMGVVCILYAFHLDTEPQLRPQMPTLFGFAGLFAALGATAGAAFLAHRRGWAGRWLLQPLPLAPVAGLVALLLSLRA